MHATHWREGALFVNAVALLPSAPRLAMVSELSERLALPLDHETVRQAGLLSGAFVVGCCAFWCCVQPLVVWCRRRVRHGEPVLM